MITKISGILDSITGGSVIIENTGIYYTVSMPPVLIDELTKSHQKGDAVLLFTYYFIESGVGVGNLFPKLIGFFNEVDRSFFEIYITVKGLGEKKALQSMIVPVSEVANAIERNDVAVLKSLPGIGGRLAEKIVAELRGKLLRFTTETVSADLPEKPGIPAAFEQAAVNVLISQLGYRRIEADQLIRKAVAADPDIESVEQLIQHIFKQNLTAREA